MHSSVTDAASTVGFGERDRSSALGDLRRGIWWAWPQFCIMVSVRSSDVSAITFYKATESYYKIHMWSKMGEMPSSREKDFDKVLETIAHLT